jgi:DNA-binding GntR family transcriptional regulator
VAREPSANRDRSVLPEAIQANLRSAIIAQVFTPNETITESAVALRYAVARPTARIAIDRLVAEGLLRREANAAARVPELTSADIRDIYDNRAVIESTAVGRLAASGTMPQAGLKAQRAMLARIDGTESLAEYDIAFHRALGEGQSSVRLAKMHALLLGEIELCIAQVQAGHLLDASTVATQHQGIIDAIVAGDEQLAMQRTREHIIASRDALLARAGERKLP